MAELEPRIVHLDEALAVVDKPAGLVVHPAPSHQGPTLVSELAEILGGGDPERPGIVHRLDKGTSGLLVVARSDEAHAALQAQVQAREVERIYLALAGGHLASRTGTIDAPIGRARQRHRMAVSGAASRQARTHFAAIGHPLAGDTTYGGAERYGLERQFLHAHRLGFQHPLTGERLSFESPLPPDLAAALDAARAE
jgi:23S rRNA pseudouridine1911/1915/1917 synthase